MLKKIHFAPEGVHKRSSISRKKTFETLSANVENILIKEMKLLNASLVWESQDYVMFKYRYHIMLFILSVFLGVSVFALFATINLVTAVKTTSNNNWNTMNAFANNLSDATNLKLAEINVVSADIFALIQNIVSSPQTLPQTHVVKKIYDLLIDSSGKTTQDKLAETLIDEYEIVYTDQIKDILDLLQTQHKFTTLKEIMNALTNPESEIPYLDSVSKLLMTGSGQPLILKLAESLDRLNKVTNVGLGLDSFGEASKVQALATIIRDFQDLNNLEPLVENVDSLTRQFEKLISKSVDSYNDATWIAKIRGLLISIDDATSTSFDDDLNKIKNALVGFKNTKSFDDLHRIIGRFTKDPNPFTHDLNWPGLILTALRDENDMPYLKHIYDSIKSLLSSEGPQTGSWASNLLLALHPATVADILDKGVLISEEVRSITTDGTIFNKITIALDECNKYFPYIS